MSDARTFLDIADDLKSGRARVPDGWRQGRTAYGGLTAGLCAVAARKDRELAELRSLMINFTGPVTGDPAFAARMLRQGRNVTSVGVDVSIQKDGADATAGNALMVFGAARESVLDVDCAAPEVSAPEDAEPLIPPGGEMFAPNFIRNFEIKLVGGARPLSGAAKGRMLCWVRHRDPGAWNLRGAGAEAAFLCLGDALPPAAFPMMRAPAPISSVNWTVNLVRAPVSEGGWFLVESEQLAAREGYSSQAMRYWDCEGRLVAQGMQAVAVFG